MLNYGWYIKASWRQNGVHVGRIKIGYPKTVSLPNSTGAWGKNNCLLTGVGSAKK